MIRFLMALVALSLFGGQASAQLFPNAPWNKTYVDADGCTVDAATGQKLSCPLRTRRAEQAPVTESVATPVPYAEASYAATPTLTVKTFGSTGSAASYGSSGGFAVGKLDAQGHVITSIGSTVSPEIAKAGTGTIEALAIGDRVKFRRSLLAAARKARDAGDITAAQFFMLSAASRNPNVLDKMQAAVHEAAIEEGLATTQAIDWDSLISFIEKLIPIIIQLIDLFG